MSENITMEVSENQEIIQTEQERKIDIKIFPYNFCNKNLSMHLYINVIKKYLSKFFNENSEHESSYISKNTEIKVIEELDELKDGDVLIFFSQHLTMNVIKDRIFNYMTKYTTIMINTELLNNYNFFYNISGFIEDIVNRRGSPFVIWDCNSYNMKYWTTDRKSTRLNSSH